MTVWEICATLDQIIRETGIDLIEMVVTRSEQSSIDPTVVFRFSHNGMPRAYSMRLSQIHTSQMSFKDILRPIALNLVDAPAPGQQ